MAMQTRGCGAVHPDGVVCVKTVYFEHGCCADTIYGHDDPHEHIDQDGVITHKWEETLVVKDLPYDGYRKPKTPKKDDDAV